MTGPQLHALINSTLQAGKTVHAGAFIRALAQRAPQREDERMTTAEQLQQAGRHGGITQREKKASLRIARNLLDNGMDIQRVMKVTGLTEREFQQARH